MRVWQVLPGGKTFAIDGATSVELCVAEWAASSRFRATTTVVAAPGSGAPLLAIPIYRLSRFRRLASWRLALAVRRAAAGQCDLIVCQQHLATAARVAMASPNIPVVLQTHNFVAPPKAGGFAAVANALTRRRFDRLAGMTFISQAARADFERNWPNVSLPREVVTDGCDFGAWRPAAERRRSVVAIGRANECKGLLEAAEGVAKFLATQPDWDATFALSEQERNPAYSAAVVAALAPLGARARVLTRIPFCAVKGLNETASIALVASKWREPFGRTALEAHAGGAALISSGTGGLREISGDCALYLTQVTPEAIAAALSELATDEERRNRLAREGAQRARRLFGLTSSGGRGDPPAALVTQRLDAFYERVVAEWRRQLRSP